MHNLITSVRHRAQKARRVFAVLSLSAVAFAAIGSFVGSQTPSVASAASYSETAARTHDFVNSIGINTKFGNPGSAEWNNCVSSMGVVNTTCTALTDLKDLGIVHVRDAGSTNGGTAYNTLLATLATNSVKVNGATVWTDLLNSNNTVNTSGQAGIEGLFNTNNCGSGVGCFESIEDPNEMDNTGGGGSLCGSPGHYRTCTTTDIEDAIKQTWNVGQAITAIPKVYGPSILKTQDLLSGYSSYMNYGNLHDYYTTYPGNTPTSSGSGSCGGYGYQSIPFWNCWEPTLSGTNPILTTETGYQITTAAVGSCQAVTGSTTYQQAKYSMRQALLAYGTTSSPDDAAFAGGRAKTYFYNFIDQSCQYYGFLDGSLNRKPVFNGFDTLIGKLADTNGTFTTTGFTYTLLNGTGGALPSPGPCSAGGSATTTVCHLLLQKHDGSYRLLLWLETADTYPTAQSQNLEFTPASGTTFTAVTQYNWDDSGNPSSGSVITPSSGTYAITISDHVTELQLTP